MVNTINTKHPPIAFLSGSSAPTGSLPTFEPLEAAQATGEDSATVEDPVLGLITRHKASLVDRDLWHEGDPEQEPACDAELELWWEMISTVPTTQGGLAALAIHVAAHPDLANFNNSDGPSDFIQTMAKACKALLPSSSLIEPIYETQGDVWARTEFKPWTGEGYAASMPPSNEEWAQLANPYLITTRLAWLIMGKSKTQQIEMLSTAEGDELEDTDFVSAQLGRFEQARDWFKAWSLLIDSAAHRLMCSAAAYELQKTSEAA